MDDLPLKVRQVYDIIVHNPDPPNPCRRQIEQQR
jgi:hypothetical protein